MQEDVETAFKERLRNPFFGYFIFNLIFINGLEFFYLFASDKPALDRIEYFKDNTGFFSTVFFPLLFAAIIYTTRDYIRVFSKKITSGAEIISKRDEFKHGIEIEKMMAEQAAIQEQALIDQSKRDQEIEEIMNDERRQKVSEQIEQKRRENESNKDRDLLQSKKRPETLLREHNRRELQKQISSIESQLEIRNRLFLDGYENHDAKEIQSLKIQLRKLEDALDVV